MDKKFEISYKELLNKLFQIQSEMSQSITEDNNTLFRLLEIDMYKTLDLLNLNSCEFCRYKTLNKYRKCDLEMRCQSYMLIKKINETDKEVITSLEFIFKLISSDQDNQ